MYKLKLSKKRLEKLIGSYRAYRPIPHDFTEFCALVTVISGEGFVPFQLYEYQKEIYKTFQAHKNTLLMKPRQAGVSEEAALIGVHSALLNPAYSAVYFSHDRDATTDLARRCRMILNSLTEYTETETDNIFEIKLKNGGRLYFKGASPEGATGLRSLHHIFIDEAAVIDQEADIAGGVRKLLSKAAPAQLMVGDKAKKMIISTPRGMSGYFYDMAVRNNPKEYQLFDIIEKIQSGKIKPYQQWTDLQGWGKIAFNYMAHPEYSKRANFLQEYADENGLSMDDAQQEMNLSFTSSAEAIFNPFLIRSVAIGNFTKEVDNLARYYIGVDTSGDGRDYFVAVVIKHDLRDDKYYFTDMYRKRKATKESHILKISELIAKYRPQTIGIEVTGNAGGLYLEDLKMRHLDTVFKEIQTTGKSKPFMIERLSYAMEKGLFIIPDDPTVVEEFNSFQRMGSKMEAIIGKTDDIVMALAFAITISDMYQKKTIDLSGINLIAS
jgi:hypothetical protein